MFAPTYLCALVDEVRERRERLLDGRVFVPAVDLVAVQVIGTEAIERPVDLFEDVFVRESLPVGALAHPTEHLRRDDEFVPSSLDGVPDDALALAVGVDVRGVEDVDPRVDGAVDDRVGVVLVTDHPRLLAPEIPAAQTEPRYPESRSRQSRVLHVVLGHSTDCPDRSR